MKIIQIIVKEDTIYGLCDEGQLWQLDVDEDSSLWTLMKIPFFVDTTLPSSLYIVQDNNLKINLTGR